MSLERGGERARTFKFVFTQQEEKSCKNKNENPNNGSIIIYSLHSKFQFFFLDISQPVGHTDNIQICFF